MNQKKAMMISHVCDGLATSGATVATFYTLHVATNNLWAAGVGALVICYLLFAFFWMVMPMLNNTSTVSSLLYRSMRAQGQDEGADGENSPHNLMSGMRGKPGKIRMGFAAPLPQVVEPAVEAPASTPTVAHHG